MHDLRESVSHFLKSMEYLGPIRPEPQRVYTLEALLRQRLRQRGLSAWLDFLLDQADDEQLKEIDQWLCSVGCPHSQPLLLLSGGERKRVEI